MKVLNNYYFHLLNRWENGSEYLTKNTDDKKATQVYENLIKELAIIEGAKNFYNR